MLSVDEALKLVLEQARPLPAVATPLGEARGRVLAEAIVSDIDSPPHDKSALGPKGRHSIAQAAGLG